MTRLTMNTTRPAAAPHLARMRIMSTLQEFGLQRVIRWNRYRPPTRPDAGIMKQFTTIFILVLLSPITFSAQLAAPNTTGVSMGHLHYHVRDVAAAKKFWMALGATPTRLAGTEVMKFPDVLVFLTEAESAGG